MAFRLTLEPVVGRLVRTVARGSAGPLSAWTALVEPGTAPPDGGVVVSEPVIVTIAARATVVEGLAVVEGLEVVTVVEVAVVEVAVVEVAVVAAVEVEVEVDVVEVLGVIGAAIVTTCQTPPKDMMPSPFASLGVLSPPYRYSGRPLSVTWSPFAFVVDPRPVTPGPGVGSIPAGTTSGGQNMVQAPEHSTGLVLLVRV